MSAGRRVAGVLLAALFAVPLFGQETPGDGDLRTRVLLRHVCASELGSAETTLFANGTVRLRRTSENEESLALGELSPPELEGYLARLGEEDLSETDREPSLVTGDWVERCELSLTLSDEPAQAFVFDRYHPLSLALSRVMAVVDELTLRARERNSIGGLPAGYEPRLGDVVARADNVLFEVVGFTWDGQGVELQGVSQPLTVYVGAGQMAAEFIDLVSRRDEP